MTKPRIKLCPTLHPTETKHSNKMISITRHPPNPFQRSVPSSPLHQPPSVLTSPSQRSDPHHLRSLQKSLFPSYSSL
ncbi:hypothetical protein BC829DRAFT_407614, partial [Chytridium lagenaria]